MLEKDDYPNLIWPRVDYPANVSRFQPDTHNTDLKTNTNIPKTRFMSLIKLQFSLKKKTIITNFRNYKNRLTLWIHLPIRCFWFNFRWFVNSRLAHDLWLFRLYTELQTTLNAQCKRRLLCTQFTTVYKNRTFEVFNVTRCPWAELRLGPTRPRLKGPALMYTLFRYMLLWM